VSVAVVLVLDTRLRVCLSHRLLKIDLQIRLPQRHRLRSRDDSIADQRPSIFSYFNYGLLMIIIIVYMACILNYARKIAVFNFFRLVVQYLERRPLLLMKRDCHEGCSRAKNRRFFCLSNSDDNN